MVCNCLKCTGKQIFSSTYPKNSEQTPVCTLAACFWHFTLSYCHPSQHSSKAGRCAIKTKRKIQKSCFLSLEIAQTQFKSKSCERFQYLPVLAKSNVKSFHVCRSHVEHERGCQFTTPKFYFHPERGVSAFKSKQVLLTDLPPRYSLGNSTRARNQDFPSMSLFFSLNSP